MKKLLATAFLLISWHPATADTLLLEDGRIFDGVQLQKSGDKVEIHFEAGVVTIPESQVLACIIPGDPGFEPQTQEDRDKISAGFVFYDGEWVKPRHRERALEKLVEEQMRLVEQSKATRLWRNRGKEETKHFAFEYTVPQHIFEHYRDLIEAYYDVFAKTFKIKPPRDLPPLKVCFYVDYDAFLQVTGVSRGVLGFFKFVTPYELSIFYDRLDPIGTEQVIYHEIGHYLQKLIDVEFSYPHWPGESISEYYGASHWDPETGRLETGLTLDGRLGQIQLDIKNEEWVSLNDMLLSAPDRTYYDYSWGWSFVNYLMNTKEYSAKFPKFILALARDKKVERFAFTAARDRLKSVAGEEVRRVFMKHMGIKGDDELQEMEREWYAYIQNDLEITSSRGLMQSARAADQRGREQRAKRLFSEAEATGDLPAVGYHWYAELLDSLDEDQAARDKWARAIELDPLVSDYYIAYGRSLISAKGDEEKAEGKRLLQLAYEIEPDNFYLQRNLERLLKR